MVKIKNVPQNSWSSNSDPKKVCCSPELEQALARARRPRPSGGLFVNETTTLKSAGLNWVEAHMLLGKPGQACDQNMCLLSSDANMC